MKMSKRMKIIVASGLIVFVGIIISCSNLSKDAEKTSVTLQLTAKWKAKAPQLFDNVGYSKLMASSPVINKNISNEITGLRGIITNPFGIRDDILEYIINNVPQDNELAVKASIKLAQNKQKIYYGNITKNEALSIERSQMLIKTCLSHYLPNQWLNISRKVEGLLRNSNERDKHMWDIDKKYFGWEVLGTGYTVGEEDELCKKGKF